MKGWFFFPIWGMEMPDNRVGLDSPIFGDATIVPRTFLERQAPADPISKAMFSGCGLREVLEKSPQQFAGPAPIDWLIDIPPGAFIAVRRKTKEDAQRYAETVRAFLTGTAFITSGTPKGFALTPLSVHWAAIPSATRMTAQGELQTDYRIVIGNLIHHQPILATHRHLSASWKHGSPVFGTWSISRDGPFAKTLIGNAGSLNALQLRVRDAASTLARAMESTDMATSTLFGVVALESLLKAGNSDFKEMEQLATCIFDSAAGPAEIARLFVNRHRVAHEAKVPEGQAEHSKEIAAVWTLLYLADLAAGELSTVDEFLEHLHGRLLARRVARLLQEAGKPELAGEVQQVANSFIKKSKKR